MHLQEVFHGHDPHGIELRVMTFLGLARLQDTGCMEKNRGNAALRMHLIGAQ